MFTSQLLSLRFNGHFPGRPELAVTRMSPILDFIGAENDGRGLLRLSRKMAVKRVS